MLKLSKVSVFAETPTHFHISSFSFWHFSLPLLARRLWFLTSQTRFTEKHKKKSFCSSVLVEIAKRKNGSVTLQIIRRRYSAEWAKTSQLWRKKEQICKHFETEYPSIATIYKYWSHGEIFLTLLLGYFQWLGIYIFLGLDCVWKSNSCSTKSTRFPWSEIKKSEKKIYCSSLCRKENTK